MSAIDVLFDWSPTSERVHQFVLSGLLQKTNLLNNIGVNGKLEKIYNESENRLYDITIELENGNKVNIELKIDSELKNEQIQRQLSKLSSNDTMIYILLGITRFSWDKTTLNNQVRNVNNYTGNLIIVDLEDMIAHIDNLILKTILPEYKDYRDLLVAYGFLLRRIKGYTCEFQDKELKEWGWYDWFGFYNELNSKFKLNGGIGYVNSPSGGFVGYWWNWKDLGDWGEMFLQLEKEKLCFKIYVKDKANASSIRQSVYEAIIDVANSMGFNAVKPNRWGSGETMTVCILDLSLDYRSEDKTNLDWNYCLQILTDAENLLTKTQNNLIKKYKL